MRTTQQLVIFSGLMVAVGLAFFSCPDARLAHAQPSASSAASAPIHMALCDAYHALDLLIATEKYSGPIKAEQDKLVAILTPLDNELKSMRDKLQTLQASDPAAQALAQAYQTKVQEFQRMNQTRQNEYESFLVKQNYEAYNEVVAATNTVAAKRGYNLVLGSRLSSGEPPRKMGEMMLGLIARPVLVGPSAEDITADVIAELKIPAQPAGAAVPPGAGAGSDAKSATLTPPAPLVPASSPAPAPK